MLRRELLASAVQGSLLAAASLLIRPAGGWALGGTLPELNAPAPQFRLPGVAPDPAGLRGPADPLPTELSLADFAGRWLVLYFYPRDFTGGCTLEARGFQNDLQAFQRAGADVVGVSADDADSHASFCSEEGLVFPLLSDPGGKVSQRYGSWIAPFSQRHTFLIDPSGVLRSRWVAVRPSGHSREVLAELSRLQALSA
ncbi:peroxiredoxin [Cyanobium sp. LEGE 06143]|uniref:peroxiredoxin n=1 Tax=Cyanobium sp. LEGE 06143 TaxID=945727 RepID=UPI001881A973|nr:peroxiredoxin [Cyanobium sp. LEGE 06143]MBE9171608.1 peroxiredoxin [Cyanobium sp. LEGE 06143]